MKNTKHKLKRLMIKLPKLHILLLFLVTGFFACTKYEKDLFTDNNWKLVGFVDVEAGNMKVAEPTDEWCYTLLFKKNKKWEGISSSNSMQGKYKINYNTHGVNISIELMTMVAEFPDGNLYLESLEKVDFFSVQESELKLYYNNNQNYLLYKFW